MSTDVITLTVPAEPRFATVARIVVGGLAARLDLSYEAMDDLQLAVESVLALDGLPASSDVTIEVTADDTALSLAFGPLRADSEDALRGHGISGLDLETLLGAVVDRATIAERAGEPWLVLEKGAPPRALRG